MAVRPKKPKAAGEDMRRKLPLGLGLVNPPENEMGVVALFMTWAKRKHIQIVTIQAGFPDCIAIHLKKKVRIEFEYRASNFITHKHDPKGCDWIVCWENNLPRAPKGIKIISLANEFGVGSNVWMQPVAGEQAVRLSKAKRETWSVAHNAQKGDLVLYYRTRPDMSVADLFQITGRVDFDDDTWKEGGDYMANINRVASLDAPIHLRMMQRHPLLKDAPFIRNQMTGRMKATLYWPDLHDLILKANPSQKRALSKFDPETFGV
ncbi:MAG: hypothetical protein OEL53_04380 [Rhodospirillales bacterium]|nr:hypothetical protein [Rhodospirillales bacterium]